MNNYDPELALPTVQGLQRYRAQHAYMVSFDNALRYRIDDTELGSRVGCTKAASLTFVPT